MAQHARRQCARAKRKNPIARTPPPPRQARRIATAPLQQNSIAVPVVESEATEMQVRPLTFPSRSLRQVRGDSGKKRQG